MQTFDSLPNAPKQPSRIVPRVEQLTLAHNLVQLALIEESGMDPIDWIDTYGKIYRDMVTLSVDDAQLADIVKTKKDIESACLANDIATALRLVRQLYHFPYRAAA